MLKDDFYARFKSTHLKAYFSFPEIPSFNGFSFEKLTEQNFANLYLLFEGDTSPFVDERFKTNEGVEEYAKFNYVCGAYLPKHGCQDWFFKWNDEYAGILHLYDLSLETFAQYNKRAWIGFATAAKFRNRGISVQVVNHFIQYVFDHYHLIDFIHSMTLRENNNASLFLRKRGFIPDEEERLLKKKYNFFLRRRM
jgi:GNAT superfamily N-acetyltransferase